MRSATRFDITQNKNIRKKADRKALSYKHFVHYSHVAETIFHLVFNIDGTEVIFLDDHLNATWLVSECNNYIVGSGVLNKIYRS